MKTIDFNPMLLCGIVALSGCGGSHYAAPKTYSIGGAVSGLTGSGLVLLDNAGDALSISGNGAFTFSMPVSSGAGYAVTVGTQPTAPASALPQTCTVASGSGAVGNSNVVSVEVGCINNAARFLYLTNGGSNTVSAYSIDNATGALAQLSGSPFAAGTTPIALTIHPTGKYAYAANAASNSISAYTIDTATGALAAIAGSPYLVTPYAGPVVGSITPIAIDPSGQLAIVANSNATLAGSGASVNQPDNLDVYGIDASSGALTPVIGSPFTTGGLYPRIVAVDPQDKFVYVVNYPYAVGADESALSVYSIDASTKTVTGITGSPFFPLFRQPTSFTISPSGKFAYFTNSYDQTISSFTTNASTGYFTVPNGSIPAVTTSAPALTAAGQFLYAVDSGSGGLYAYGIDGTTGAATAIAGSPYPAGLSAAVTVDPSSHHVYVVSPNLANTQSVGNAIFAFDIDPTTGALSPVTGSPFNAAGISDTIGTHLVIDPSGRFAYLPSATSAVIYAFGVDATSGALSTVPGSPVATGVAPGTPVFLY
jgi:6-phosphogluconolactonase (cycloisomerase 2 family)